MTLPPMQTLSQPFLQVFSLQKSSQQNYTLLLLATKMLVEAVIETGVVFRKEFLTGNFFVSMGFQMAIDYVYIIHNVTIIHFED